MLSAFVRTATMVILFFPSQAWHVINAAMNRNSLLSWALTLAGCVLLGGCGQPADPAAYPSKTITVICPWSAGGGTDSVSRFFAGELEKELGETCVVVNQTGGSGAVGHTAGAQADADGHTILMGTFELSTMHWMGISDLTYQDFTPLMQVNKDAAAILVKTDAPWQSLDEFVAHLKANKGKMKLSGTASGGAWDLARAGFMLAAGMSPRDAIWVPTQGSAPSILELLGGHIDAVCCSLPEAAAQLESGQLRALAVMSDERLTAYPEVPTVKESGIEWEAMGWRGLMLPKGTPQVVIDKLVAALEKITASEAYVKFMQANGFGEEIKSPAAFAEFLAQQDAQWESVIREAGYAAKP
ncbi:MAG: tripartite-type tricarboxylate transporter receptor subunit TctC [Verrucomicrobiales bacterium]|jgi:tripartite-type tricarboxylate transporter receptor subunit TctC